MSRTRQVRLSLEISPAMSRALKDLALKTGGTKSDVLRKAVALMEVAVEARERGEKFGVAEKDQPLVTEIVGL
jgi:hypothetical protein